jgi:hypothetical protein
MSFELPILDVRRIDVESAAGCGAPTAMFLSTAGEVQWVMRYTEDKPAFSEVSPVRDAVLTFWTKAVVTVEGGLLGDNWSDETFEIPEGAQLVFADAARLDSNRNHVCGLTESGRALCWNTFDDLTPVADVPEGDYAQLCMTEGGALCLLDVDGYPTCWAEEPMGEPPERFDQISCGESHVCGTTLDGRIVCWGECWNGECDPPA